MKPVIRTFAVAIVVAGASVGSSTAVPTNGVLHGSPTKLLSPGCPPGMGCPQPKALLYVRLFRGQSKPPIQ